MNTNIEDIMFTLAFVLELLSIIPAMEADAVKLASELSSSDDGKTKLVKTIANIEQLLEDLKTAL